MELKGLIFKTNRNFDKIQTIKRSEVDVAITAEEINILTNDWLMLMKSPNGGISTIGRRNFT
jgi:hypothetical protein